MAEERDQLRPLQEAELGIVREWRNHPDVRRFMYTQHEIGAEEHLAWFERAQQDPNRHLLLYLHQGIPMGFANIAIVNATARRAEWGFYLAPDALRGSGHRLGRAVLAYAFETLCLHKLCGEALAFNTRSIRFHERLGFTREATLRDHHFDGQSFHDVVGFGLLASDRAAGEGAKVS
ncbi:UDP-4-amino-4,6-dideoxy-N-acetyl-beta-L-altrosamine N-acetyltransferase [Halomonas daqingensis]|uniref:UDP-4-amino-4, 6-dideoxy-N-acetyl-beta-L-altrosamine N-acetyltransferase n=1 Tax=Billgrantia desiderata TaxID=52021 RepID=A0ABS9AZL2_9GAMM|nr:UDP-4-amino-4,6-dideoxy-N-acetyl-beta-L-altrosamine N-acetyltransferase [Halomonas desiderata]MCE8040705.1 UDP-4-amino-4,6-dideoxy-N-acetyl-beta-L-altrosamine N-acetyltransferase [Halomonas desiderata]MCE8045280.1 UDP-4-amino-4,6-dideoxy-N-acetyl-beta-L-altrosamine N-acetyltransferase [Halomonas desiderata]